MVGICAWGAWHQYRTSGRFEPLYAIIAVWGVSYLAYRWYSLRRQPARARRVRTNRIRFTGGFLATTVIWLAILFVAVLALAVYKG